MSCVSCAFVLLVSCSRDSQAGGAECPCYNIEKCIELNPASTQLAVHCDRSDIDSQAGGAECPCYNVEKCIELNPASTHSRLSTVSAATCQI
ncbi:hypothetical protein J6590_046425 [Homalodisca vitripennis]|nr:hypothetical protein J6590_046425 [Homalodisca vitripennis]